MAAPTTCASFRGDGNAEYFLPLTNNEYKSSQTTRKKLAKLGDGSYRIYDETGKVLFFNAAGRLVRQERSLSGLQAIDFSYEGDKLVRAQDHAGRALTFVYTGERLSRITLPDGSAVDYSYDADANFERATYADGSSKRYHYNEAGLSLANDKHALTGIKTENGLRYSSYGYNANGRVNLSQRHKGDGTFVEKTTIDYANPQQPVVTLPYGEVVTYNLRARSGIHAHYQHVQQPRHLPEHVPGQRFGCNTSGTRRQQQYAVRLYRQL